MGRLLRSSHRIHVCRPLSMPVARTVARADAVAMAFDYEPEKAVPVPPSACVNYGKELPDDLVCPATCTVTRECYTALQEASK